MTNQELYKMLTGQGDGEKNLGVPSSESQAIPELSAAPNFPRLDFFLETNRKQPVTLLIEEESGLIVAELPASERGLDDAFEITRRSNAYNALIDALRPFAEMDREGCDLHEIACERGVASDLTIITSGDFRHATEALALANGQATVSPEGSTTS